MLIALVTIVGQVYFDLKLPDYMSDITTLVETPGSDMKDIWIAGGKMLLISLGSVACAIITGYIAARVAASFTQRLRSLEFRKVESFGPAEMSKFSTASLITRSTNDVTQVQMFITMGLQLIVKSPIMAVWAVCKIAGEGFEWTLATGIAVAVLLVSITVMMAMVMPKFKVMQTLTDNINLVARENLTGLRVVRAYNAEQYQEEKFGKVNEEVTRVNLFTNRVMGLMSPFMMIVMNGITLAIYWLGASLINEGSLDFATMTAFSMLAMQVLMAFMMLTMLFIMLPRASVSAKRINEVLETENRIGEPAEPKPFTERATVEMKNVSFRYPDADGYVLKDISFRAKQGDTVAFIGATGSGKSTLVNLIPRFYDIQGGAILIDGVDIRQYDIESLREYMGVVSQETILFNDTIANNLRLGKQDATDEEIIAAAKAAHADSFIRRLPEGYNTVIAEDGGNISQGQKQLLCIARVMLCLPPMLILDEATSSIDTRTEVRIQAAFARMMRGRTSFIVAHRLSTIREADVILVMKDGHIVEQGNHDELLAQGGFYATLYNSQFEGVET